MSIRLIITHTAVPGKGNELAALMRERALPVQERPGCMQYEVFQSAHDLDRLVTLEQWQDKEALAAHAKLQLARPSIPTGLRVDSGQREDYEYNRTR